MSYFLDIIEEITEHNGRIRDAELSNRVKILKIAILVIIFTAYMYSNDLVSCVRLNALLLVFWF